MESRPSKLETFSKGSFAGACSAVCLQPLDVVKTRQQGMDIHTQDAKNGPRVRVRDAVKEILQNDGTKGLWRGLSPSLLRSSLGPGVYFLILDMLQGARSSVYHHEDRKLKVFMEGAVARGVAGTLLTPLTVVKTRFEWSRSKGGPGIGQMLAQIAKEEKLSGLFRGAIPTLIRDVPSSGLYLMLYQGVLQPMSHRTMGESVSAPALNLLSAVSAAAIASIVTHPADALKTHVQLNNLKIIEGFTSLWRARGIMGFFSGVAARMVRRPLSMGISWTIYEVVKDMER